MKPQTLDQLKRQADSTIGHARSCKKSLGECKQCERIVSFYAGLPLATLAVVIEDRPILKSRA
jgi:hypothetical protein